MKSKVEDDRHRQRQQNISLAKELMRQGNLNEANKKFIEGIEINNDMIHLFIQELKHAGVKYIVSPYESDA
jgi:exonuclease-1